MRKGMKKIIILSLFVYLFSSCETPYQKVKRENDSLKILIEEIKLQNAKEQLQEFKRQNQFIDSLLKTVK